MVHQLSRADARRICLQAQLLTEPRPDDLLAAGLDGAAALQVEAVSGAATARFGRTYADFDSGEYGALFDPRGWLTLVRGNPASALEGLGLSLAAPVWLTRPDV